MCECYQVGGRFIAEDPDCPAHGSAAQAERAERELQETLQAGRLARLEECVTWLERVVAYHGLGLDE